MADHKVALEKYGAEDGSIAHQNGSVQQALDDQLPEPIFAFEQIES
jgi:hypothetical protein